MTRTKQTDKIKSIPIGNLREHPLNSNRMPPRLFEKLKTHLRRTGLYEPVVVRPLTSDRLSEGDPAPEVYQILNGHHRVMALEELGRKRIRCVVWDVSESEALVLLATLNRLEGRDDPQKRGELIAAIGQPAGELASLLPETTDALERLSKLVDPPPAPIPPAEIPELDLAPMVFYLTSCERRIIIEALKAAADGNGKKGHCAAGRGEALERLCRWFLEAKGEL